MWYLRWKELILQGSTASWFFFCPRDKFLITLEILVPQPISCCPEFFAINMRRASRPLNSPVSWLSLFRGNICLSVRAAFCVCSVSLTFLDGFFIFGTIDHYHEKVCPMQWPWPISSWLFSRDMFLSQGCIFGKNSLAKGILFFRSP